jgi:hypothetical protein
MNINVSKGPKKDQGVEEGEMESMVESPAPARKKGSLGWAVILGVVVIVLVLVVLDRVVGVNIFTSSEQRQQEDVAQFLEETGTWHAVFLTNGQVYFGQLENPDSQYAKLSDIYYLQLQQVQTQAQTGTPVNDTGEAQVVSAPTPEPPRLTLIKFGTELHRPADFMMINRDHILFWEDLTSDSQVVQAIQSYKAGQ